ncbi:MAG: translation initiation factor IF-3 [Verrucomicrobiota bacterium]|nr:translation initiation factor IF-3 [Verrucomicrobiota bacterium]
MRANHKIRVPMVRCINGDGTMVGVVPTREALKMAIDQGLDLVEVSPNADPPVCRIMDFGKFRYDESIKEKEARKKAHRQLLKEMKFHANVGEHDYDYKIEHIKAFLGNGHKVKASLQFRGRENAHRELGFEVIKRVLKDCAELSAVELAPRLMGNTIVSLLTPRPGKQHEGDRDAEPATARPAAPPLASSDLKIENKV